MSIYRRRTSLDFDGKDCVAPTSRVTAVEVDTRDWSKERKASPANYLLPVSKAWIEGLPPDLVPSALAAQHPRIVNLIAIDWTKKEDCRQLFEELLDGKGRKNRRGFAAAVERDLWKLRDYWYTRFPS